MKEEAVTNLIKLQKQAHAYGFSIKNVSTITENLIEFEPTPEKVVGIIINPKS